ncbi:MAG: radical SAM family heme chaperone HemW [Mariprofundaceae bacterium]
MSPLQLYIHIPFCVHKCHYCDFNSHVRDSHPWASYQQALLRELEYWAHHPAFSNRKLSSIFIGGGTPSLAPPSLIESILKRTGQLFHLIPNCEITLESNPGTVDADHFKGYRAAGVNRLSIGVQSLNNDDLKWLERIHDRDQAVRAYEIARASGFNNINLDLMYGLPHQSLENWLQILGQVINLEPEHLSCYQLTVEPHTQLAVTHAASPYALPDEEQALELFHNTRTVLAESNYSAYEISNFSKPDKHCRHNDGYWLYHDYIGIGAGASGKWDQTDGGTYRYSNKRNPDIYMKHDGPAISSDEHLTRNKAAAEAIWLGLRRTDGIDQTWFEKRFQTSLSSQQALIPWLEDGYLTFTNNHLHLTDKGLPFADSIASSLL